MNCAPISGVLPIVNFEAVFVVNISCERTFLSYKHCTHTSDLLCFSGGVCVCICVPLYSCVFVQSWNVNQIDAFI